LALASFKESQSRHLRLDNAKGYAFVCVNLARLYIAARADAQWSVNAKTTLDDAIDNLKRAPREAQLAYLPFVYVQHAQLISLDEKKQPQALALYRYILDSFEYLEPSIREICEQALSGSLSQSPNDQKYTAEGEQKYCRHMRLILMLDVSGSMGGFSKIKSAREALIALIGSNKFANDSEIGLYTFSDEIYQVFPMKARGPIGSFQHQAMIEDILNKTEPVSGTALYLAIAYAYATMDSLGPGQNDFIVILTDGDNNRPPDTIHDIVNRQQPKATVAIFTVGDVSALSSTAMATVANAATQPNRKAIYQAVQDGAAGIDVAFQKIQLIISGKTNVETL